MNRIGTVNELVETLNRSETEDYVSIVKYLEIPAADLMEFAFWKDGGYTRNCIERTENFELLLLCWNPGDSTPVHCHGQQRCWVYQVSGSVEEVTYKENKAGDLVPNHKRRLKSGDFSYMDDSMGYHTLENTSEAKAMSLHLYAKPIDTCTYFDNTLGMFIPKDMDYHSYKGEIVNNQKRETKGQRLARLTKSAII